MHTICVDQHAANTHVSHHGDSYGACGGGTFSPCDPSRFAAGTEEEPASGPAGKPLCGGKKVLVCHIPPGNPANMHTICIGAPAVEPHQRLHGDPLGPCAVPCATPAWRLLPRCSSA